MLLKFNRENQTRMINKKRLVNTFKDLVKIDSISRDEKKVANYIIKKQ